MLFGGIYFLGIKNNKNKNYKGEKTIWITWEKQIRNRSMSKSLNIPLYEIIISQSRILRYVKCVTMTVKILLYIKPEIVLCSNPSLILTLILLAIRHSLKFKVVIDAHYGGVVAYNGSSIFQKLLNFLNRSADFVIVTNENHARHINSIGGKVFICPDPLPNLAKYESIETEFSKKVFFICSFDPDEPFLEVFQAAKILKSEGFRFFVSGNFDKAGISKNDYPYLELMGFISELDFYRHLFSSQLVIDLTDNDNCLVCGAYEALRAFKPIVLSNKEALRTYFTSGTVFTENKAVEISEALIKAYNKRVELEKDARNWVNQENENMKDRIKNLKKILDKL